jgi:hypothetical protein
VTKRPQAFLHVGLLINKHGGLATMSFDMLDSAMFGSLTSPKRERVSTLRLIPSLALFKLRICRHPNPKRE